MNYLTKEILSIIHRVLSEKFKEDGEPLPPFTSASLDAIDSVIKLPQSNYFGMELYPTIQAKAAIIFYTINKKHIFENGNKRMSVSSFLIFLALNDYYLEVSPDELTEKALWLASTTHEHDFDDIKSELTEWISAHAHKTLI